ncbi:MAG: helix-turn-helix transcriptional regulator [Treponema sp.]|nr:helix-turn-helix transcriptional regulator [Treponema sp.]
MTLSSIFILLLLEVPILDNSKELKVSVETELSIFSRDLETRLGDISSQLVRLSELLSKNIEFERLTGDPQALGEVLENEFDPLIAAMDRTKSSSVFLVLDFMDRPGQQDSDNYRAGVCFRDSNPDLYMSEVPKQFLRGAPTSAYGDNFMMLEDWELDFDVKDRAYFHSPLDDYNKTPLSGDPLPMSGYSYWGFESIVSQTEKSTILCSIPVTAGSDRKATGVCGFETDLSLLMENYLPEADGYKQIFCKIFDMGGNGVTVKEGTALNTYTLEDGKIYLGQHKNIKLNQGNSVLSSPQLTMAILIPKEEIDSHNLWIRGRLVLFITVLVSIGIFISLFISKKYLHPVMLEIGQLHELIAKKDEMDKLLTPGEIEIALLLIEGKMRSEISRGLRISAGETDRRIESIRNKIDTNGDPNPLETAVAREFKLTPREKEIFRCMLNDMNNTEISGELFISEGTVKNHVHNILLKLKINNRRNLIAWAENYSMQNGIKNE